MNLVAMHDGVPAECCWRQKKLSEGLQWQPSGYHGVSNGAGQPDLAFPVPALESSLQHSVQSNALCLLPGAFHRSGKKWPLSLGHLEGQLTPSYL